jgi:hypothetical protein
VRFYVQFGARIAERFPGDFMFRLSAAQYAGLISQFATSKSGRGRRRKLPWAFTEHGEVVMEMLDSLLAQAGC